MKCAWCPAEFSTNSQLESHEAGHKVKKVSDNPPTYLLVLPDGCTPGRWEAAEAFAEAVAELRQACPEADFQFVPFSYVSATMRGMLPGAASNVTLDAILAIQHNRAPGVQHTPTS